MANFTSRRKLMRMSQHKLSKAAGVSRFKIALAELGEGTLTPDETARIDHALRAEARRIREALAVEARAV